VAGEAVDELVQLLGGEVAAARHHCVDAAPVDFLQLLLRGFCRLRGGDVHGGDDVGLGVLLAGLVRAPVCVHGLFEVGGGEVAGESVGETQLRGKRCPEEGRPEDDDRHVGASAGHGMHTGEEGFVGKVSVQLLDVLGEAVGGAGDAPDGAQGLLVGAGRAPES